MSGDYSEGEGSGGHEADFVNKTADTEVELRLPREYVPAYSRADDLDDIGRDEQRRLEPLNGSNRNRPDTGCRCPSKWINVDNRRGLEQAVVSGDRPFKHIRDWPNADRGQGPRRPHLL